MSTFKEYLGRDGASKSDKSFLKEYKRKEQTMSKKYLESLHEGSARLIEISKLYYTTFPDQPALEPKHIDIYAGVIRELYPELTTEITTDSAGCHMIFRLAPDHVACISTVENTIGLYDSFREQWGGANDDDWVLGSALEHDPIYLGHLGDDWN